MNILKLFKKKDPGDYWADLIEQGILSREEVLFLKKKRATEEYDKEVSGKDTGRIKIKIK
jgi:hypothetical protein